MQAVEPIVITRSRNSEAREAARERLESRTMKKKKNREREEMGRDCLERKRVALLDVPRPGRLIRRKKYRSRGTSRDFETILPQSTEDFLFRS